MKNCMLLPLEPTEPVGLHRCCLRSFDRSFCQSFLASAPVTVRVAEPHFSSTLPDPKPRLDQLLSLFHRAPYLRCEQVTRRPRSTSSWKSPKQMEQHQSFRTSGDFVNYTNHWQLLYFILRHLSQSMLLLLGSYSSMVPTSKVPYRQLPHIEVSCSCGRASMRSRVQRISQCEDGEVTLEVRGMDCSRSANAPELRCASVYKGILNSAIRPPPPATRL
ncbi:hypothetical protein SCHPADRAFT_664736 [Schizopora paradoxa]|uniref:Uncharacterized protein n=1 Tax=Schizopora paradoxa TaxID=27342 RepID=A0A0H2RQK9_9AGAM|nr:hypothetical protein SCHPADRAFT_664736 [Schizopora paradoxa]